LVASQKNEQGEIKDILESNIDITERKQIETKLEEYTRNLERLVEERTKKLELSSLYARSLIEASLDPLVTISAEGKITDVNKATELTTGYSRQQLIGSDFSNYFTEPEKAKTGYKRVFTQGYVTDYPLAVKHKSGKITYVLYNATVYRNEAGEIQGIFAAARDVTERKQAEAQAQEASKKLKDAERLAAIGATAGMVGHDIRNPLQAITSDVYLAKTDLASIPESEERNSALESLQEIQDNVEYINKIVADLQDYARILKPVPKETNLEKLVEETLKKNVTPKNVKVQVKMQKEANTVLADSDILKRILGNLVTNAIQAMPEGGKLSISTSRKADDIVISVQDTGVGIPEDVRGKLFQPLFTTKSKGHGFGLAVVKRMTEALGGTVTFESEEGKGTKFSISLPAQQNKD
jgi:PAS domain S-box-containing protein